MAVRSNTTSTIGAVGNVVPEILVFGALFRTRTFSITVGAPRGVMKKEKPLLFLLEIPRGFMGDIVIVAFGRGRARFGSANVERRCSLGDLDGKQL